MFDGEGFEPVGGQVPDQTAAEVDADARNLVGENPPFGHGPLPEADVEFGIAPAGIDPGERAARRDAPNAFRIDDRDGAALPRQMMGDDAPMMPAPTTTTVFWPWP